MYKTLSIYNKNIKYQGKLWVYFMRLLEGEWLGFLVISMASCHFFISQSFGTTRGSFRGSEVLEWRSQWWGGGLWLVKRKELVFICETSIIALSVIFILLALPPTNISLPYFISDFLPNTLTLFSAQFSHILLSSY